MFSLNPSFQGSADSAEEEAERLQEPEWMEDTKETRPSKHSKIDADIN